MDAEGLPPGALSLEDNPTIVGITEKTNDPPPAGDPGDEDPTPEGTIEGSGGVKFVPLDAVIAERTGRKAATKENAELKTKLTAAEQKAAKYDELAGYVEQARPIIERVRANPALANDQPPARVEAPKALSDTEAVEYAKDLDLYKPDGTPDVDRAQRLAGRQAELASRSAQAAIAPFQANDAQRASHAMQQQIAAYKDNNGHTVDAGVLKEIWAGIPPELSAKPEVAAVLYQMALGQSIMQGKYGGLKPAGPGAVVPTESLGGGGKVRAEIDQTGAKFARAADIKTADFQKTAERFKPGQVNSLE